MLVAVYLQLRFLLADCGLVLVGYSNRYPVLGWATAESVISLLIVQYLGLDKVLVPEPRNRKF